MAIKSGGKPRGPGRTRSRVKVVEGDSRQSDRRPISGKSAEHRKSEPYVEGMARLLDTGEALISSQFSEVAPVGRFAGVTIGPIQIAWKLQVDMSALADVDWDSDTPLTKEQQAVYDRVKNAARSTGRIIQHLIDEDREVVDKGVERWNQAELEEEQEEKKTRRARK